MQMESQLPEGWFYSEETDSVSIPIRDRLGAVKHHLLIDKEDVPKLVGKNISTILKKYNYLAVTVSWIENGVNRRAALSHLIIGHPPKGHVVDHKNNCTLNNKRSNLHFVTYSQNSRNKGKQTSETSSNYIGVSWDKVKQNWMVRSNVLEDGISKKKYLGNFDNEIHAAHAYDEFVRHEPGAHLNLNGEKPDGYMPSTKKPHKNPLIKKGIWERNGRFVVQKVLSGKEYVKRFDNLQPAEEYLDTIEKLDEQHNINQILAREITRNLAGQCYIETKNGVQVIVDENKWYDINLLGTLSYKPSSGQVYLQLKKSQERISLRRYLMKDQLEKPENVGKNVIHLDKNNLNLCLKNLLCADGATANHRSCIKKRKSLEEDKYHNIYQDKKGKWMVECKKNGKKHYGGSFNTKNEAAQAANILMKRLYGEQARLNIIKRPRIESDTIDRSEGKDSIENNDM